MRTAAEIKKGLLHLRFEVGLPAKKIADDSGCSVAQFFAAMRLDASELVQRRLDAYLDAGKMHKVTQDTKRAGRLDMLSRELWHVWGLKTMKMSDVYLLSPDRQIRLELAMNWRLKRALREYVKEKTGVEPRIPDSYSYWKAKAKVAATTGFVAPIGELRGRYGAGPVLQNRVVHPRQNPGR